MQSGGGGCDAISSDQLISWEEMHRENEGWGWGGTGCCTVWFQTPGAGLKLADFPAVPGESPYVSRMVNPIHNEPSGSVQLLKAGVVFHGLTHSMTLMYF